MVTGCDITPRFIVWRVITCGMGGFPNRGRPSFPGYYHSVNFQQNRPILTLLFPDAAFLLFPGFQSRSIGRKTRSKRLKFGIVAGTVCI